MKKLILINVLIIGSLFSNEILAQKNTNSASKVHLTMLYEHYINLKSAFIKSDSKSVIEMAKEVLRELPNAENSFYEIEDNKVWEEQLIKIKKSINAIVKDEDIEKQRESFSILSNALFQNIKAYGVIGMPVYYQFCPMALNGKGAYWLSLKEKIGNPYFGNKMLTCGETKEIISISNLDKIK
jgi:Cu(I)/Ag(I) efflux system membrane fusion protein